MGHPEGGQGSKFATRHSFRQAYASIGEGLQFSSTKGNLTTARHGNTESGAPAINFYFDSGERAGNVCEGCWGFRKSCVGTRIGQWVEGLDRFLR